MLPDVTRIVSNTSDNDDTTSSPSFTPLIQLKGIPCDGSDVPYIAFGSLCVCPRPAFGGTGRQRRCGLLIEGVGAMLPVTGRIGIVVVRACRCLRALPSSGTQTRRLGEIRGDVVGRCSPEVGGLACSRKGLLVGLIGERYGSSSCTLIRTFLKPIGTNFCRTFT